ncbi:MAG: SDR family NAD(P)-dependent oxidoreductase, partial [Bryobacterales bacterium]|nr:SDR family NAD(P)-dependent oxidoreductase [Bryobacterales bacterium]
MEIDGTVVLITGASEGIGAACAQALRGAGAKVALMARTEEKLHRLTGPEDLAIPGDVTNPQDRGRAVEQTLARFQQIDLLINNAGAGLYAPSWNAPMDETRYLYELNLFAPLAMIQLVAPSMRRRRRGMIVNIASIAGKVTLPWLTLYSASKYALGSLTDGLRMELRRDGIHAMTVCPGYVSTRFQDHVLHGQPPEHVRRTRLFKITPERCAHDIVQGIRRNARTVVTPASGWAFILLERLFPNWVDRKLEDIYFR